MTRNREQLYRLKGNRCQKCGKACFPPRKICPACGEKSFEDYFLPDKGKVVTWTVIHVAPPEFEGQTPYAMAVVELSDATRLFAQLVDISPEEITFGMPVRVAFRKIQSIGESGIICYGYKFVPDVPY